MCRSRPEPVYIYDRSRSQFIAETNDFQPSRRLQSILIEDANSTFTCVLQTNEQHDWRWAHKHVLNTCKYKLLDSLQSIIILAICVHANSQVFQNIISQNNIQMTIFIYVFLHSLWRTLRLGMDGPATQKTCLASICTCLLVAGRCCVKYRNTSDML